MWLSGLRCSLVGTGSIWRLNFKSPEPAGELQFQESSRFQTNWCLLDRSSCYKVDYTNYCRIACILYIVASTAGLSTEASSFCNSRLVSS